MRRFNGWLAVAPLCVVFVGCGQHAAPTERNSSAASVDEAVPVVLEAAELRTMQATVVGLGRCEALPDRIASLTPAMEGRVKQIVPRLGDWVKQGQNIVLLDTQIAEANLAEKTAARDGMQASLELLQAEPRPEDLKSQELAVELAKSSLEKARLAVERLRPLQGKEISAAQMYEAENVVKQAQLQVQTSEAQLLVLKLKPRAEAIREAQSRIRTASAQLETAQAQLKLLTLVSPIDGDFDSITCRLGQTITVGTPVGEVVDARTLNVMVWLSAREAARVKVGQAATVQMGATQTGVESDGTPPANAEPAESKAPDKPAADRATAETTPAENAPPEQRASIAGKVSFIGRAADPLTGNLPVRILVDNPSGQLHLGQSVSVSIVIREKQHALVIPAAALFDVGQGPVFNIVRDGKSVRAFPEFGLRDSQWVEVLGEHLSDLKPGEQIIVDGGYNLPEGNAVKQVTASAEGSR